MADRSPSSGDASTSGSVEHTVTKLDTLAGVAIKYGVEVADIKRLNGLTTDLQMFALKTLRIPPARHPHSTSGRSRFAARSGMHRASSHDSNLNHKLPGRSSAMDLLRGYYGLPSSRTEEGTELSTFNEITEDEPFSPVFRPLDTAADSRRLSTGDLRTRSSSLSDTGWLINSLEPPSGIVMRDPLGLGDRFGEIKVVTEADRPIRRRPRGDFGSEEMPDVMSFPERSPALRAKDSASKINSSSEAPSTIGAALFGGKVAVEGLISKVLNPQEAGKSSLPSGGALEGLTQAYRRAKPALD